MERLEPDLLREIRAHLSRVASADPAGSLTLHLAASKYPQWVPNGNQKARAGFIPTINTSTAGVEEAQDLSQPAKRRQWHHAIVEACLFTPATSDYVASACSDGGSALKPRRFTATSGLNRRRRVNTGSKAGNEELLHGTEFSGARNPRGCWPAVLVTLVPARLPGCTKEDRIQQPLFVSSQAPHAADTGITPLAAGTGAVVGPGVSAGCASSPRVMSLGTGTAAIVTNGDEHDERRPVLQRSFLANLLDQPLVSQTPGQHDNLDARTAADLAVTDFFKHREGMVLASLSCIVTAFTSDGTAALFQNAASVVYYGLRAPLGGMHAANGVMYEEVTAANPDSSGRGTGNMLAELFSLEPAKLERMMADVCAAGRVWKGIVQVPVSCHPSITPPVGLGCTTPVGSIHGPRLPRQSSATGIDVCGPHLRSRSAAQTPLAVAMASMDSSPFFQDGNPTMGDHMSASALMSGNINVDADPLATSTWGLFLDLTEQHAVQEPQFPFPRSSASCGGVGASLMPCRTLAMCSSGQQVNPRESITAAPPGKLASNGLSNSMPTRAPIVPTGSSRGFLGLRRSQLGRSSSDRRILPSATLAPGVASDRVTHVADGAVNRSGAAAACSTAAAAAVATVGGGGVQRTSVPRVSSMQGRTDSRKSCMMASLRRCTSRVELGGGAPPSTVPRVVAFASSLKSTPTAVQAALQLAVTGSCRGGQPEHADDVPTCLNTACVYESSGDELASPVGAADKNPLASAQIDGEFLDENAPSLILPTASIKRWYSQNHMARDESAYTGSPTDRPTATASGCSGLETGLGGVAPPIGLRKRSSLRAPSSACAWRNGDAAASCLTPRRTTFSAALAKPAKSGGQPQPGVDDQGPLRRLGSDAVGGAGGGGVDLSAGERRASTLFISPPAALVPGLGYCWHEVSATRAIDPVTGQQSIVATQIDVTAKVEAERHLAFVTEAEHRLLEQVFPRHVLTYMTEEGGPWAAQVRGEHSSSYVPVVRDINALATTHAEVTLLFADIQGFTPMCKVLEPRVVMTFLNDLFTRFDQRLDEYGVYKVETIGDCYFVAGGLIHQDAQGMAVVRANEDQADPHHALNVFRFAQAMLEAAAQVTLPTTGEPVRMRIGIHSGPVVSGVVGQRMPRFCLFGDSVNTASRMESSGVPGCIHASEDTWRLLRNEAWVPTGGIQVKGKGPMNTFLWAPPDSRAQAALAAYLNRRAGSPDCSPTGSAVAVGGATTRAADAASVCSSAGGCSPHLDAAAPDISGTGPSRGSPANKATSPTKATSTTGSRPALYPPYSAGGFGQVWPSSEGGAARNEPGALSSGGGPVEGAGPALLHNTSASGAVPKAVPQASGSPSSPTGSKPKRLAWT